MKTQILSLLTGKVADFGPKGEKSGMNKRSRNEPLCVGALGIEGDEQADLVHHGGIDKAIHHYPFDHYESWRLDEPEFEGYLGEPGAFGENISTRDWTETSVCIGDRFRMGTAIVEISQGRQPCWKLGHRFQNAAMVAKVIKTGRSGWYYRVIEAGKVAAGDGIELLERLHPDWNVARVFGILIGGNAMGGDVQELAKVAQLSVSWKKRCDALIAAQDR